MNNKEKKTHSMKARGMISDVIVQDRKSVV